MFVALATLMSFFTWLARALFRLDQIRYIKRHLRASDKIERVEDKKIAARFTTSYLRQDGILVLRLISINANDLIVSDLICELWNNYRTTRAVLLNRKRPDRPPSIDV